MKPEPSMVLYFPAIESATYPPMTGIMKTVPEIETSDGCCCLCHIQRYFNYIGNIRHLTSIDRGVLKQ